MGTALSCGQLEFRKDNGAHEPRLPLSAAAGRLRRRSACVRSILSAHGLAPVASGAEEPDVLRLVAAAHRPRDNVVVLDEFLRFAGPASSHVPFVHEMLHVLRNRIGKMGIELPLDALLISAFQHHEQGRYILGSAIT